MNAIFQIDAYKEGSTWYFDDKDRQISREPFVLGASELITSLIGKRKRKASFLFSETFIPDHDLVLTCTDKDYPYIRRDHISKKGIRTPRLIEDTTQEPISGTYIDQHGNMCWLCPAQLKFFGKVAETIFVKKL